MGADITVAIPHIPPRAGFLTKAVLSVAMQTLQPDYISIATDTEHEGAAATRNRLLRTIRTGWIAWLDDDDIFYPQHLAHLRRCAEETGADFVFSYFDTTRTPDILGHFGKPFDREHPHHTTMTVLVRTELAREVGFTPRPEGDIAEGEDWRWILGCVAAGAKIVHLPEQTWYWRHHTIAPDSAVLANTSGRGDRW